MLKEKLDVLAERIREQGSRFMTLESTKEELVLPFISALGYDIDDHTEVVPDYTINGSRKVDYAVVINDQPVIIIECEKFGNYLGYAHRSQLVYCFNNIFNPKLGVLTNGSQYLFYSDVAQPNVMDQIPFLTAYLPDPRQVNYEALQYLTKSEFNIDTINGLVRTVIRDTLVRQYTLNLFVSPPSEFINFLIQELNLGYSVDHQRIRDVVKGTLLELLRDPAAY